jgi:hypothetical protein
MNYLDNAHSHAKCAEGSGSMSTIRKRMGRCLEVCAGILTFVIGMAPITACEGKKGQPLASVEDERRAEKVKAQAVEAARVRSEQAATPSPELRAFLDWVIAVKPKASLWRQPKGPFKAADPFCLPTGICEAAYIPAEGDRSYSVLFSKSNPLAVRFDTGDVGSSKVECSQLGGSTIRSWRRGGSGGQDKELCTTGKALDQMTALIQRSGGGGYTRLFLVTAEYLASDAEFGNVIATEGK